MLRTLIMNWKKNRHRSHDISKFIQGHILQVNNKFYHKNKSYSKIVNHLQYTIFSNAFFSLRTTIFEITIAIQKVEKVDFFKICISIIFIPLSQSNKPHEIFKTSVLFRKSRTIVLNCSRNKRDCAEVNNWLYIGTNLELTPICI